MPQCRLTANSCQWSIDTKYYTAQVTLGTWTVPGVPYSAVESPCEAVVMVVDASREDTWTRIRDWMQAADLDSCDVRLCIITKCDLKDMGAGAWTEDVHEWCLDKMFECIQVRPFRTDRQLRSIARAGMFEKSGPPHLTGLSTFLAPVRVRSNSALSRRPKLVSHR